MDKIKTQAKKIRVGIMKALLYLRINDSNNMISLTNIAMMLVIYKIAVTPAVSFQDITALAIGIMGYQVKRIVEGKKS